MGTAQMEQTSHLAAGFLEILFDETVGFIEVRLIEDVRDGNARQFWFRDAAELVGRLPSLQAQAEAEGRAVFFGVLPRHRKGGTKADVAAGMAAWVDIDFKDVSEDDAIKRLGELPQPSIIVRSGHGFHIYWLMREATDPMELEGLSRRITYAIGADKCHDCTRILRLPGTRNLKEGWKDGAFVSPAAASLVLMPTCDPSRRYIVDDFEFLPEPELPKPAAPHVERKKEIKGVPPAVRRLLDSKPFLRDLWDSKGRTQGDVSNSGYDLAFLGALTRCGIMDPDVLDAAVVARPYVGEKGRTDRNVRRAVNRAIEDQRRRRAAVAPKPEAQPANEPAPESTPCPALAMLAEAATQVRAALAPDGDKAALKDVEYDLTDTPFLLAATHAADRRAVLRGIGVLAVHGFTASARLIEQKVKKRWADIDAQKEADEDRQQQDEARAHAKAEREQQRNHAANEEWPRDRPRAHPVVYDGLALDKYGRPKPVYSNAYKIMRDDPRWGKNLRLCQLGDVVEVWGAPIESEGQIVAEITTWIADNYSAYFQPNAIRDAIWAVAAGNGYHPVRDYLRGLPAWDGLPRIALILSEVLGLRQTEANQKELALYQLFIRRTMIGAVARVEQPGCKLDTALIFVGEQGAKKSTFFKVLFGADWFGDSPIPIGDKNAAIQLRATWGYECAEMESLSKKTADEVKQWMSIADDLFRHIFERNARRWPRHSVIVGSTNRPEFLSDPTGSRRFWPIEVPDDTVINIKRLRALRDACWAEARALYLAAQSSIDADVTPLPAHRWWFERTEEAERADNARRFEVSDVWDEIIMEWVAGHPFGFTIANVLEEALDMPKDRMGEQEKRRVGAILRRHGWRSKRARDENGGKYKDVWVHDVTRKQNTDATTTPGPMTDDGAPL